MASYDIFGDVAIINSRPLEQAKELAKDLRNKNKRIDAVYLKDKIIGRLRKPKLKLLAGKKIEEVVIKENKCLFKFNIKTCYFSPRLGADRLEIAHKVKRGEQVLVMFSGVAPYAIVMAKNAGPKQVTCIELSKEANKYARENVKMNKLSNIAIVQGDVKKVVPKLKIKFDRIIMARAQLKEKFLKEAFLVARRGTIIHFYDFLQEDEIPGVKQEIIRNASRFKKRVKFLKIKRVREIAPYRFHMRFDFKIT